MKDQKINARDFLQTNELSVMESTAVKGGKIKIEKEVTVKSAQ